MLQPEGLGQASSGARREAHFALSVRTGGISARLTPVLLTLALLALVAAGGGCGGSSGSGHADPAALVPASAPLYVSVAIKPAGGRSSAAEVAARKLTHLDEPYGSLAQSLLSTTGGKPEFKRDIAPWVGERAGVFATSLGAASLMPRASSLQQLLEGGLSNLPAALGINGFGAHGVQGAIVLQTSDASAARSFLSKQASGQGGRPSDYRGVSFDVTPAGVAEGIVKNFAVVGSESGMRAAIDASLGGARLSGATGYSPPPSGAIASAYLKPVALGAGSGAGSPLDQLFAGARSATLTATATDSQIAVQGVIRGIASTFFGSEGAHELAQLPASAWLAAAVGEIGANLPRALALLQSVGSLGASTMLSSFGGPSIERLFKLLASPKTHLRRDFGSWAGAGGIFVGGSSLFNLQAGLVIASLNPAASRAAVARLAGLMREAGATISSASIPGTDAAESVKLTGFPAVIFIADGGGKFVLGLGQQSVEAAITPSATLSTSGAYSATTAALGQWFEPSLIVEFPTLLGFVEGVGLTQSPTLSPIVPYLKSLGTLRGGANGTLGVTRYKILLGLT